jgi:RNA polymerase subunit RPABC4/transcription elongation factor Spt4
MGSKICPECQTEIPSEADVCTECGYPFEPVPAKVCPSCGNQVPDGVLYCPVCTHEGMNSAVTAEPHQAVEQTEAINTETNIPEQRSAAPVNSIDSEIINNRLQALETTINLIFAGLQELKAENAQKETAASIISAINTGTETQLKPISTQLAALPEIAKKLTSAGTPVEGNIPKSIKWLDYLFVGMLVMMFFMIIDLFITAYIVRIMPVK